MFVSRNRGRADRQMHASVDTFQGHRNDFWFLDDDKKNGLTNCSSGLKYSQCVVIVEIGVDGRADVDDGVTHIEAMGCWRTRAMGGCTRSEEETEKREDREETHVAEGWRDWGLRTHKGI